MIKEIYNRVYTQTEYGKQKEAEVSDEVSKLLEENGANPASEDRLEELLSAAAGIGIDKGFQMGLAWWIQLLAELICR
ncbi:hypothetical protein [Hespellia stercorisuis]|uniref:Uncharacterized protein n=1 Tax=Hespellia stercorisuis DSM 15480 TaxID=1121950 RepID=A0A1M6U2U3_9FIRM|nr:hypothetical protein [Hespellia stercorisuis]SHK63474.1 hypothetical protein SAMN02745243_03385 [Hespellia stercorisuis DSM 15480]